MFTNILATIYLAVASQCDSTPLITADNTFIECEQDQRIIAVSREFLDYVSFGDTVLVICDCPFDGHWVVHDVMNKRFTNCGKIDFLIDQGQYEGLREYSWTVTLFL